MFVVLDGFDVKLLVVFQENVVLINQEIGDLIGLFVSQIFCCWQKLEDSGVICWYCVVFDLEVLGLIVIVFVGVVLGVYSWENVWKF